MKSVKLLLGGACLLLAASGSMKAQTVAVNGLGSSALFLALGQSAASSSAGVGATCVWSTSASNVVVAVDTSVTSDNETGSAWIAWTPGTGGSCTSPASDSQVYSYLQTDSVVGDRCLFNGCKIQAGTAGSPTSVTTSSLILPKNSDGSLNEQATVPTVIWNLLAGQAVTAAGTDIRPEDAQFAVNRALTSCGGTVNSSNTNYKGLGYSNGDAIKSHFSTSNFRVVNFTLPSSYSVTTVGAVPVIVAAVGPDYLSTSSPINNITSGDLAKLLSGTFTSTSVPKASTVLIREPLSGTYNTMEYNIPNIQNATTANPNTYLSQDVGGNSLMTNDSQQNCNGSVPQNQTALSGTSNFQYEMNITTAGGGARQRAIGTGQEVSTLLAATTDTIGYSFWSTANFKNATSSAKYLTVDSIDPLFGSYSNGQIPTTGNGLLSSVTFTHVQDGTYPIWSSIRLVNKGLSASAGVTALANAAQTFVPATPTPDFVKKADLAAVHSHFTPPGVTVSGVSNGSKALTGAPGCSATEKGGDVGGQFLTASQEQTYCTTISTTGHTELRK